MDTLYHIDSRFAHSLSIFLPTGMGGQEVLRRVESGMRMPRPTGFECPESLYEIMLKCWAHKPADRPTFDFLYDFFDDYFVATEPNYQEI